MASTLTGTAFNANLQANISPNISTLSGNIFVSDQSNLSIGTGSTVGSADGSYTISGSVTAGTPVVINLLALADPFGNALTVGHVVALKITNTASAGNLSHGGGTNPVYAAMPTALAISPGDFFAQSFNGAGLVVTSGSAQNLTLTASAGTVTFKVTALVRSA